MIVDFSKSYTKDEINNLFTKCPICDGELKYDHQLEPIFGGDGEVIYCGDCDGVIEIYGDDGTLRMEFHINYSKENETLIFINDHNALFRVGRGGKDNLIDTHPIIDFEKLKQKIKYYMVLM